MCEQLIVEGELPLAPPTFVVCTRNPRAAAVRKSLTYGGVHFEECDDEDRCLTLNNTSLKSSDASLRTACRLAGLYPCDTADAGVVDDWIETHRTFVIPIEIALSPAGHGPREAWYNETSYRAWLLNKHIPRYLAILEAELTSSKWLGGMDNLSMADVRWYETLSWLKNGCLEGITYETLSMFPAICMYLVAVPAALML